ncbi:MAG: hypothetical protein QOH57_1610 [Mycobacterium sp.]|nr:hypothetical protein [Mycobacterium sp.]
MIIIRTSVVEYGIYRDDYEAFLAALRDDGFAAQLDQPMERRSVGGAGVELGIWIVEHPEQAASLIAVAEAIRRAAASTIARAKKARRTQQLRRLPIYGPDDKVLMWVDLPADDDS